MHILSSSIRIFLNLFISLIVPYFLLSFPHPSKQHLFILFSLKIARESEFATGTIIPEANTTTKGYLFEALDSPKRAFEEVKAGDYVEAQRRHGDTSGGAADVGAETGAPRPIAGHSETLLMRALPELDSITDYPVFTFAHRSCMAKLMSPAIYHVMESRRTSSGFSLARAIRCGEGPIVLLQCIASAPRTSFNSKILTCSLTHSLAH